MDDFYKIPKNKKIIEKLLLECKSHSIKTFLEIKNEKYTRVKLEKTFEEVLELFFRSPMHWVFIKRNGPLIFSPINETPYYEIGGCTMGLEYDTFMFIFIPEAIGTKLIEKYKLKKIIWKQTLIK